MNDARIRFSFHQKWLLNHHRQSGTLVIDELGLQHGRCRADIAVINSHIIGYEIKSDVDSLHRLHNQIEGYNAIFDRTSIVVSERHLAEAIASVPQWWGVISVTEGLRGGIHFKTIRRASQNTCVDDYAVAQLLWSNEAREILAGLGISGKKLREKRSSLYRNIVVNLDSRELRRTVRECLKIRKDWRDPTQLFPHDGSSLPNARS